jgi:SAM-dependent methyltransferase
LADVKRAEERLINHYYESKIGKFLLPKGGVGVLQKTFSSYRHLDLGCGDMPRNPYIAPEIYGVDIRKYTDTVKVKFCVANLAIERIPFEDDFFSSVSAYDFIEHIPRVLYDQGRGITFFPFVELMNEIHRVLIPKGRFYAVTPCFPAEEAFQDPTHVNYISANTYRYFCGDSPEGRIYGFNGHFRLVSISKGVVRNFYNPYRHRLFQKAAYFRRLLTRQITHIKWEFEKV